MSLNTIEPTPELEDEEYHAEDEGRPLLGNSTTTQSPAIHDARLQGTIVIFIYAIVFFTMIVVYLQPAPRTQLYESIICLKHYKDLTKSSGQGDSLPHPRDCKIREIQEELALVQGVERVMDLIPTFLVVPYSLLSQRWGRSFVYSLSLLGGLLDLTYTYAVCWFSGILPLRLVWASSIFMLLGGGPGTATAMLHLLVSDVTLPESRTSIFFRIEASNMAAGIVAPSIGALIMSHNVWLPPLISVVILFGCGIAALFIPNTIPKKAIESLNDSDNETGTLRKISAISPKDVIRAGFLKAKTLGITLAANKQVGLILLATFVYQIGYNSFMDTILLYVSKRYDWSFAKAGLLISLNSTFQLILLVLILPFASYILVDRYRLQPYNKDRYLTLGGISIMAIGFFIIGLAPQDGLAIFGTILMSIGYGTGALLRSLLTIIVSYDKLALFYSTSTMLVIFGGTLSGPIYSTAFTMGLRLGTFWYGLPFLVGGGLLVMSFVTMLFLKQQKAQNL